MGAWISRRRSGVVPYTIGTVQLRALTGTADRQHRNGRSTTCRFLLRRRAHGDYLSSLSKQVRRSVRRPARSQGDDQRTMGIAAAPRPQMRNGIDANARGREGDGVRKSENCSLKRPCWEGPVRRQLRRRDVFIERVNSSASPSQPARELDGQFCPDARDLPHCTPCPTPRAPMAP
ncbi:hypothetical protein PSPO01_12705 [Paraphaeosphaeria sporulosa]